jgi:hypothetical protein
MLAYEGARSRRTEQAMLSFNSGLGAARHQSSNPRCLIRVGDRVHCQRRADSFNTWIACRRSFRNAHIARERRDHDEGVPCLSSSSEPSLCGTPKLWQKDDPVFHPFGLSKAISRKDPSYGPPGVPLWSDSCVLRLKGHWITVTYTNIVAFSNGPALIAFCLRDSSRAQCPNEENTR